MLNPYSCIDITRVLFITYINVKETDSSKSHSNQGSSVLHYMDSLEKEKPYSPEKKLIVLDNLNTEPIEVFLGGIVMIERDMAIADVAA